MSGSHQSNYMDLALPVREAAALVEILTAIAQPAASKRPLVDLIRQAKSTDLIRCRDRILRAMSAASSRETA